MSMDCLVTPSQEFADAQQHLGRLLQLYRMRIVAAPHSPLSHRHSAAQSQQHQFQGSGLSPQAASRAASSAQQANNSPGHEGGRQPRTRRHSQTLAGRDSAPQPMQPAIAIADDRPVSPLSVLLHHPLLEDVQNGQGMYLGDMISRMGRRLSLNGMCAFWLKSNIFDFLQL
eukprot:1157543-Pelagomonas_calceolata.AAC.7